MVTKQIQLVSRPGPKGPSRENFKLVEVAIGEPAKGEVLLETLYLSLDPYMRARMYEGANYTASTDLGTPMVGNTISRVIAANDANLAIGDIVESNHGWQSHHITPANALRQIIPTGLPISTELGVLGLPGHTGYGGLLRYGKPQKGETVLVSAASGAVGSMVGQVAKIKGCRVIGIAGSESKCRYLIKELGFDAAINRHSDSFANDLAIACPNGIDVYFDNVGGDIFAMCIPLLNTGARVPICGTISVDRNQSQTHGIDRLQELQSAILVKQLTLQGFLYSGLLDMTDDFRNGVSNWIKSGELKYREDVINGLENAPNAFLGLFRGNNFGKLIIRVKAID